MTRYAATTNVPVTRSMEEVRRTMIRYLGYQASWAILQSSDELGVRMSLEKFEVRIVLPMPQQPDFTKAGYEQEVRRMWRVLLLVIKSKIEMVEIGAETEEQAFLPYICLPSGGTVTSDLIPQIMGEVNAIALGAG